MRNTKRIMWLIVVTAIVCALTLAVALPASANENANVAKIGDTEYATLDAASKAAKTGDTITLLRDVDLGTNSARFYNPSVSSCHDLTFDLNGHTITSAAATDGTVIVARVGLVIKNGTIVNTNTAATTAAVYVTNKGTTTLENITLKSTGDGVHVCKLTSAAVVVVNVNDGTTVNAGKNGIYIMAPGGTKSKIPQITLNVNGGTITGAETETETGIKAAGPGSSAYGIVGVNITGGTISGVKVITDNANRMVNLNVTGGTIDGDLVGVGDNNIAISGGTFNGNLTETGDSNNAITISGGTFSSEVKPEWCAKDFAVKANDDGTYSVKTIYVAKTGDNRYESLAAAISAASNGATVELLTETTEDVVIDKNITLDLGGFTLTGNGVTGKATLTIAEGATATVRNGSIKGTANSYYTILNNGTATFDGLIATAGNDDSSMIDNYGTLTINSGNYTGGRDTVKNEPSAMLTISGGTFTLTTGTSKGYTGVVFNCGTLEITGGEFIQSDTGAPYGQAQVIYTHKDGSLAPSTVIKGGAFKNLCTHRTAWTVRATNAAAGATKVSGGTFNKSVRYDYLADGFIPAKNSDGTYGVKKGQYVADIDGEKYETLADAIAAAEDDDTITLLKDIYENVTIKAGQQITLDLNGKTLNGGTGTAVATITNHGTLTINDSVGGGRVMRNDSGIVGEKSYYVINNFGGTLTIESGSIYNNSGYKKTNPSGSMVGSSLIRNGGSDDMSYLYIKGGTMTQKNFLAVKNDPNGILEITGGEISSDHSAVQNWFKATITGGKITGQLWTDSYVEGESVGETVIGGNAEFNGEIVIDITGNIAPALRITGGTLNITNVRITTAAAAVGAKPAVSGGVFNIEIKDEWCVEGFAPKALEDGKYGVEQLVKIVATEGVLGESIKFYILADKGGYRIRVTLNGEEVIYNGVDYEKDGKEYYAYILDLPPQYLDADIKIELINNSDEAIQTVNYSFLEYCEAVLKKDANAKQLVADLLWYSVAAKNKCRLDSAALVARLDELGLVQSTDDIKATVTKSHTKAGSESFISGATLYHDSMNRIIILVDINLYKNTIGDHTYTYRKGDGTAQELVKIGELDTDGPTYVMLATEGIYANEFDTAYTIEVTFNGEVVETLVYSVNNYCETKATENELAKALYYYGVSAAAYKHS